MAVLETPNSRKRRMSSSLPLSRETPNEPFGRPSFSPEALALARPSRVRSEIRSRSTSANSANLTLPCAHLVRMNRVLRGNLLQRPIAPKRLQRDLRFQLPRKPASLRHRVSLLSRWNTPQTTARFSGATSTELFGQNERLFLTDPCRFPTPTSRQRILRHGFSYYVGLDSKSGPAQGNESQGRR